MLAVVTGPVRSGKSSVALDLALQTGREVVLAVGGRGEDEEMARRIARHQADRPSAIRVREADASPSWVTSVPKEACLVVDCLGTVLSGSISPLLAEGDVLASPQAEEAAEGIARALVGALRDREGCTVVVCNEVGWGLVPAYPAGRLFRDVAGRATRWLVDAADVAWLVVAGRCVELSSLPSQASWAGQAPR